VVDLARGDALVTTNSAGGAVDQPKWLVWAQQLQSIAQAGLTYSKDPYDTDRYRQLRSLAADIAADHLAVAGNEVRVVFEAGTGYPTPKVDVRSVIFRDGRILLVRERAVGLWSLPGGWADIGLSAGEVAVKETREETGYYTRPRRLLALYDKAKHPHPVSVDYVYKVFILCDIEGGAPETGLETDAVDFFASGNVPPLDARRVTAEQVQRMFQLEADTSLPVDFD
jgi:ADP-ribose pyrophosphatase YjhB (NUDIX family)